MTVIASAPGAPVANRGELTRETFTTSRLLDFFSEKELTAQVGHGRQDWPLVAVKELIDNALDACEDARISPQIHVEISTAGITVADNGPGIPAETVTGVLDFTIRVSSREAYVSPCRGAQGNALKTLVAMPFVLDGGNGMVEIEAHGVRHRIVTRVDRIAQKPILDHQQKPGPVKNGSCVRVFSLLNAADDDGRFLQLLRGFAFANPHLHLSATIFGNRYDWPATSTAWKKWFPSDLAPAHWYGPEHLERLMAAYLSAGKDLTVREFLLFFSGLRGTAKQKAVLEETGLSRQNLSGLVHDGAFDRKRTARLLEAMQRHSKNVKPEALGLIGRDQVSSRMQDLGAEMETFQYDRQRGETNGIPWVIETAFAWSPSRDNDGRLIVTGVNWSPGIVNPFRELGSMGCGLDAALQDLRVGHEEPVLVFVHMAAARVQYTDRGKSAVLLKDGVPLLKSITKVTSKWTRQRKQEERDARSRQRRSAAMISTRRITIQEAAFCVMTEAYLKASAGGTLPANARQIMYAARGPIQELTGRPLDDNYFTQSLLPDYVDRHAEETSSWDVVYDARGHFVEPHTGREVPLGTLAVRDYLSGAESAYLSDPGVSEHFYPTHGACSRFGAILFIEKEGFLPLLQKVQLAERYDSAIMSTKGMSSTAARRLVDSLCKDGGVPLLIVRDFDKAGFSIAATLQNDTRRYTFQNTMGVHDLGLRLADVEGWNLQSEMVSYGNSDPTSNLIENGATEEEIAFLLTGTEWRNYSGRRVELNAFTSGDFVRWLEAKLDQHGVRKVLPDEATLRDAYRRALKARRLARIVARETQRIDEELRCMVLPQNLLARVTQRLKATPELSWDGALADLVDGGRWE